MRDCGAAGTVELYNAGGRDHIVVAVSPLQERSVAIPEAPIETLRKAGGQISARAKHCEDAACRDTEKQSAGRRRPLDLPLGYPIKVAVVAKCERPGVDSIWAADHDRAREKVVPGKVIEHGEHTVGRQPEDRSATACTSLQCGAIKAAVGTFYDRVGVERRSPVVARGPLEGVELRDRSARGDLLDIEAIVIRDVVTTNARIGCTTR